MAIAIPGAFGARALLFAGSYVAIQVGRAAFLTFAAAGGGTLERQRASRILLWFTASGVLWLGGAVADGSLRALLWVAALALDYGAPLVTFRVPGLARVSAAAWELETSHFAERFQLFVIIALGETIVVTGATTADLELDATRLLAFALAFLTAAGMWWLYFNRVADLGRLQLARTADRTLLARDAYTYLHVVMVAGVIVSAVGDELVIAHPGDTLPGAEVAAVVAGPAIYLLAHALFRLRMTGTISRRRLAGAIACAAAGIAGAVLPALALAALVLAVLAGVIAAEQRAHTPAAA
jgi:low temperature requirement protein LtrA